MHFHHFWRVAGRNATTTMTRAINEWNEISSQIEKSIKNVNETQLSTQPSEISPSASSNSIGSSNPIMMNHSASTKNSPSDKKSATSSSTSNKKKYNKNSKNDRGKSNNNNIKNNKNNINNNKNNKKKSDNSSNNNSETNNCDNKSNKSGKSRRSRTKDTKELYIKVHLHEIHRLIKYFEKFPPTNQSFKQKSDLALNEIVLILEEIDSLFIEQNYCNMKISMESFLETIFPNKSNTNSYFYNNVNILLFFKYSQIQQREKVSKLTELKDNIKKLISFLSTFYGSDNDSMNDLNNRNNNDYKSITNDDEKFIVFELPNSFKELKFFFENESLNYNITPINTQPDETIRQEKNVPQINGPTPTIVSKPKRLGAKIPIRSKTPPPNKPKLIVNTTQMNSTKNEPKKQQTARPQQTVTTTPMENQNRKRRVSNESDKHTSGIPIPINRKLPKTSNGNKTNENIKYLNIPENITPILKENLIQRSKHISSSTSSENINRPNNYNTDNNINIDNKNRNDGDSNLIIKDSNNNNNDNENNDDDNNRINNNNSRINNNIENNKNNINNYRINYKNNTNNSSSNNNNKGNNFQNVESEVDKEIKLSIQRNPPTKMGNLFGIGDELLNDVNNEDIDIFESDSYRRRHPPRKEHINEPKFRKRSQRSSISIANEIENEKYEKVNEEKKKIKGKAMKEKVEKDNNLINQIILNTEKLNFISPKISIYFIKVLEEEKQKSEEGYLLNIERIIQSFSILETELDSFNLYQFLISRNSSLDHDLSSDILKKIMEVNFNNKNSESFLLEANESLSKIINKSLSENSQMIDTLRENQRLKQELAELNRTVETKKLEKTIEQIETVDRKIFELLKQKLAIEPTSTASKRLEEIDQHLELFLKFKEKLLVDLEGTVK